MVDRSGWAWLAALWLAGMFAAGAQTAPPAPQRIGMSEKICQLTGDTDWETNKPSLDRTHANFGLDAVDLGYPVEHGDKLILLFGDTRPATHGGGVAGEVPPDDSVGFTTRRVPPGSGGKCLDLKLNDQVTAPGAPKKLAPPTIVGTVKIKQGWFNVPSGGVSVGGGLFVFFWTDHCTGPAHLEPSPNAPLAYPPPSQTCSENDDRNSIGRAVLARSSDDGRTFGGVVSMPTGFVYATALDAMQQADLPKDQQSGVFVFAVPRYRASVPYLALAPRESFADPSTWRYFAGRDGSGAPKWVTQAAWTAGATNNARENAWRPPGDADIISPANADEQCIGEFSVTWNRPLHLWLMLYGCHNAGVMARVAGAPWGPWSAPTLILGQPDGLGCHVIMAQQGCPNLHDFWPDRPHIGKVVAGALYAPFVLDRYTTAATSAAGMRSSTIYWLVSTWNPYEVTIMRTTLQVGAR